MAMIRCPAPQCTNSGLVVPDNFQDTIQCDRCGAIVRAVMIAGRARDVRLRKFDLDVPVGLPADLEQILAEAVACFEIGSNAATVVLTRLFLEGLLTRSGAKKTQLVKQIEAAKQQGDLSPLGYHVASASRLLGNIGAHYSDELLRLTQSDARLVLEMARKIASDLVSTGKLK